MKSLNRDQLKSLLLAIPQERHRLMILMGFWHGARVSELINIKAKDVQGGYLTLRRLKGSRKTVQPLVWNADPLFDEMTPLLALVKTLRSEDKLFKITRFGVIKLMQRAGNRANIAPHLLHPHVLKHSIAMIMIKAKPIKEVQVYLGHVEGKNTMRYLEATEEEAAAGLGNLV